MKTEFASLICNSILTGSSGNPLHYLVERVSINAPIEILKNGIEFIDTPGLNDPDLYRVRATEKEVEGVNVILFLTTSGASYSLSDKEFLLTQIRKRKLRHLRLIITKYDITFENARRQAEEEEEEALPTLESHFKNEEIRVRQAMKETLDEIINVKNSTLSIEDREYFYNLLNDIKIHFISSNVYTDGKHDLSGIPAVREDLTDMIKNDDSARACLNILNETIIRVAQSTRAYIGDYRVKKSRSEQQDKNEKNYAKIQQIASELLEKFEKQIIHEVKKSHQFDSFDREQIKARIKMVGVRAQDIIDNYQRQDSLRHWRTKRNKDWVQLDDFANKVANRIFPEFESTIRLYQKKIIERLGIGIKQAKQLQKELDKFSSGEPVVKSQMREIVEDLHMCFTFDEKQLDVFFDTERHLVVESLESFLDEQTYELIDQARSRVTLVYGKGTNDSQNREISDFYHEFGMIIRPRLEKYLFETFETYTSVVSDRVINIYKSISHDVEQHIEDQKQIVIDINRRQMSQQVDIVIPAMNQLESHLDLLLSDMKKSA